MPFAFVDTTGRTWPLKITVASAEAIEDATGVDLQAIARGDVDELHRVVDSRPITANMCYRLATLNGEKATPREFYKAIRNDPDGILDALLTSLADFADPVHRAVITTARELKSGG
jgi:hypothetical protein